MLSKVYIAALTAITSVSGHMLIVSPTPYGVSDLNNSPLAADGSDYPCKQRGANTYNAQGANNQWPIGSTQTLAFKGSAVHGGGSCQVSLTSDKNPDKNSKFFVIHSIVGGCPSNQTNGGNLPSDPNGSGANKYTFTVPDGVAPGEYTMAWTWFNRIGNREMYMNCAPVTVIGGAKKRAVEERKAAARSLLKRANFPEMFVANIGNGCGTSEGADVEFPNPGASVEKDAADGKYAPPTGSCASGSGTPAAPGGGSGSSPAPPASSTVAAPSQPTPTLVTQPSANPNPPPAPAPSASSSAAPADPAPSAPAQPAPSAPVAPAPGAGIGAGGAMTGACTTGQWNCFNGGASFQQCGSGIWSVGMATAAGNPCKGSGVTSTAPW